MLLIYRVCIGFRLDKSNFVLEFRCSGRVDVGVMWWMEQHRDRCVYIIDKMTEMWLKCDYIWIDNWSSYGKWVHVRACRCQALLGPSGVMYNVGAWKTFWEIEFMGNGERWTRHTRSAAEVQKEKEKNDGWNAWEPFSSLFQNHFASMWKWAMLSINCNKMWPTKLHPIASGKTFPFFFHRPNVGAKCLLNLSQAHKALTSPRNFADAIIHYELSPISIFLSLAHGKRSTFRSPRRKRRKWNMNEMQKSFLCKQIALAGERERWVAGVCELWCLCRYRCRISLKMRTLNDMRMRIANVHWKFYVNGEREPCENGNGIDQKLNTARWCDVECNSEITKTTTTKIVHFRSTIQKKKFIDLKLSIMWYSISTRLNYIGFNAYLYD